MKKTHPLMLFLKIFKSIRLALILIGYLVVTSIVATLIPQGKEISFYAQYFSYPVYRIIIGLNIDNFFRSLLFIIPLSIFTINLAVCTVTRIINRFRSKLPVRLGADIIHVGLLLLIFAGVITLFARKEGFVFLAPGDVVSLPNGYELKLKSFAFQTYQYGRPKSWISEVEIINNDRTIKNAEIHVNKPLRLGNLNIFQQSYKDMSTVIIKNPYGREITLHIGNAIYLGDSVFRFTRILTNPSNFETFVKTDDNLDSSNKAVALFTRVKPGKLISKNEKLNKLMVMGDRLNHYKIIGMKPLLETGFNVVYDPGFLPILIGILLVGLGLVLTFIQKIGDKKLW